MAAIIIILYYTVQTPDTRHCLKSGNIAKRTRVARYTSMLGQCYDLHEIKLTQKEALLEQKYLTGSMPSMPTLNHSPKACRGPGALNSTISFKKCGKKTGSG